MNNFRRFLGKISAETYLKWIIFIVNLKNRQALGAPPLDPLAPAAGGLAPIPSLDSITRNMCKILFPRYIQST